MFYAFLASYESIFCKYKEGILTIRYVVIREYMNKTV